MGLAVAVLTVGIGLAFADDQADNSVLGINGGGAPRGINGGGAPRGINGGGAPRGINGGGAPRGINGGGAPRGINGGGAPRGINGGGAPRGINGGGVRAYGATDVDALFANSIEAAMGPVEGVQSDGAGATVKVAGQSFPISASDAESLQVGDYVVVADTFGESATIGAVGEMYVPGVSVIRVRGRVQSVSDDTAKLVVNGVVVDYAAALTNSPSLSIQNGSLIEFSGTQPTPGGTVLVVR